MSFGAQICTLIGILIFQDVEIKETHLPDRREFCTGVLKDAAEHEGGEDAFVGTLFVTDQSTIDLNGGSIGRLRVRKSC